MDVKRKSESNVSEAIYNQSLKVNKEPRNGRQEKAWGFILTHSNNLW